MEGNQRRRRDRLRSLWHSLLFLAWLLVTSVLVLGGYQLAIDDASNLSDLESVAVMAAFMALFLAGAAVLEAVIERWEGFEREQRERWRLERELEDLRQELERAAQTEAKLRYGNERKKERLEELRAEVEALRAGTYNDEGVN